MISNNIVKAITKKITFLFFNWKEDLFLNEEEPHLKQTILPPNDLSETKSELPQFKQILIELIPFLILHLLNKLYIYSNVKKKFNITYDNENLLQ